jgi:arylsulfatase
MSNIQKTPGEPGSPRATTTLSGIQLPAPDPKFGGMIDQKSFAVESVVAAACSPAEGRTKRVADHDRR